MLCEAWRQVGPEEQPPWVHITRGPRSNWGQAAIWAWSAVTCCDVEAICALVAAALSVPESRPSQAYSRLKEWSRARNLRSSASTFSRIDGGLRMNRGKLRP